MSFSPKLTFTKGQRVYFLRRICKLILLVCDGIANSFSSLLEYFVTLSPSSQRLRSLHRRQIKPFFSLGNFPFKIPFHREKAFQPLSPMFLIFYPYVFGDKIESRMSRKMAQSVWKTGFLMSGCFVRWTDRHQLRRKTFVR